MKALIFDLDGTLIDSVYPHTLAWQKALSDFGLQCPAYAIHRRIGMSGKLLVKSVAREQACAVSDADIESLEKQHLSIFRELAPTCAPLPGARELLDYLDSCHIAHGIATSGNHSEVVASLKILAPGPSAVVIDGDMVEEVKPEPDLFMLCRQKLQLDASQCLVVGDAIWDIHAARRAGILAVGLLTGGYAGQELYNAGESRES
jgi:HAD superfamily hydrolase (TIGR01509 family)